MGPLFLEMYKWTPGDIAMADGSRPGHQTHSGKSILQPALVNLVSAGAEVHWLIPAWPCEIVLHEHQSKGVRAKYGHMRSCDCTFVD